MKHFFGIVEDRNDPLKIGRVRVRIHGIHTDNKLELSTPKINQPIRIALTGSTQSPSLGLTIKLMGKNKSIDLLNPQFLFHLFC